LAGAANDFGHLKAGLLTYEHTLNTKIHYDWDLFRLDYSTRLEESPRKWTTTNDTLKSFIGMGVMYITFLYFYRSTECCGCQ